MLISEICDLVQEGIFFEAGNGEDQEAQESAEEISTYPSR